VSTSERRLYLVLPGRRAIKYGIGVGREGFEWAGTKTISRKQEWPDWTPPPQMLRRRPDLPQFMPGGPENPLGARAMYLGGTLYRIHGSNEPETIGTAVSSGCIRMLKRGRCRSVRSREGRHAGGRAAIASRPFQTLRGRGGGQTLRENPHPTSGKSPIDQDMHKRDNMARDRSAATINAPPTGVRAAPRPLTEHWVKRRLSLRSS